MSLVMILGFSYELGDNLKVDSHILRYDAARHEAVQQDAAKTHGCCSHMQHLPL